MSIPAGCVLPVSREAVPVPGCTVSEALLPGSNAITDFIMAAGTDISAELYPCHKLITVESGSLIVTVDGQAHGLAAMQSILTPCDVPVGTIAYYNAAYSEILIRRNSIMNSNVTIGEVFSLKDLIPVQPGRIVNMDVAHNDTMKLALMAFDAGTGLDSHAAPGDAIIFALEGEGIIVYEGVEHPIKAGENFRFTKGGMHAVKADSPFKMALLLVLA